MRAVDKRLGRTVAVKELLRQNESNEARFMREALITARLQHPGIVPVHEAGRWPSGDPYYVMKLVEGRTLKELIAFSPDGTQLASSSYDKTIRIWQFGTQRARVLRGHSGAVDRVVWRDDSHLVTGGRDATLRIWDVPSMDLPTAGDLAGVLNAATSARIDLDRPTTTDGLGGSL